MTSDPKSMAASDTRGGAGKVLAAGPSPPAPGAGVSIRRGWGEPTASERARAKRSRLVAIRLLKKELPVSRRSVPCSNRAMCAGSRSARLSWGRRDRARPQSDGILRSSGPAFSEEEDSVRAELWLTPWCPVVWEGGEGRLPMGLSEGAGGASGDSGGGGRRGEGSGCERSRARRSGRGRTSLR